MNSSTDARKIMRPNKEAPTPVIDEAEGECGADGLQIREVAALLGISRSRVIQIEQKAMQKLRSRLTDAGFESSDDLDDVGFLPEPKPTRSSQASSKREEDSREELFAGPGWFRVDQIVCINGAAVDPVDVSMSFAFLSGQRRNEKLVKIPFMLAAPSEARVGGFVNGANVSKNSLRVHASLEPQDSKDLMGFPERKVTAIVETHVGRDGFGEFRIPVLLCVIASASGAIPKQMRDYFSGSKLAKAR